MLKNLLSGVVFCALSTAAFAADLPSRTKAPAPVVEAPASWTGFYLGVQGGVARTSLKYSDLDYWYSGVNDHVVSGYNPALGLKAGYDFNSGALLTGVGAEFSFGRFKGGGETSAGDPTYDIRSKASLLGSLRGKLGLATSNVALFSTAGLAFSNAKHSYDETDGSGQYSRTNGKHVGWVVGVGADYKLSAKTSIGVELSHYQFGNETHKLFNPDGSVRDTRWRQGESYETLMVSFTQRF